jgi:hypothetical protein
MRRLLIRSLSAVYPLLPAITRYSLIVEIVRIDAHNRGSASISIALECPQ